MIGAVIVGLARTHATASWVRDRPASSAIGPELVDGVELAVVPVAVLVAVGGACRG